MQHIRHCCNAGCLATILVDLSAFRINIHNPNIRNAFELADFFFQAVFKPCISKALKITNCGLIAVSKKKCDIE